MSNDYINDIQPLISNEVYKIINTDMNTILESLFTELSNNNNNSNFNNLKDKYKKEINKIGNKLGIKKRNRRVLPSDLQCMGRKIDGKQCTRSRLNNLDYCKSHNQNLHFGRIDEPDKTKKKGKRGRKKKDDCINNENYITVFPEVFSDGKQYFVDSNNYVYTYNLENPEFIGIKNTNGSIILYNNDN